MRMELSSPRNTQPNQIDEPSAISTSPMIVAFGAMKTPRPMRGVLAAKRQDVAAHAGRAGLLHGEGRGLPEHGGAVENEPDEPRSAG